MMMISIYITGALKLSSYPTIILIQTLFRLALNVSSTRLILLQADAGEVIIGVKDDKYQQVYTKYFGRVKPQRDDLFVKALNDEYGSFNADFNADLKWGTHVSTATLITPDTIDENEAWASKTNGTVEIEEDLPF